MKFEGTDVKEAPQGQKRGDERKQTRGQREGSARFAQLGRLALAAAAAGLVTLVAVGLLPDLLPASTDIVGFPIWYPFDVRRYIAVYTLWMVLFPVLAATGFVLLGGSRRGGEPRSAELSNASAQHEHRPRPGRTATLAALVLAVLPGALSLGMAAEADGGSFTLRFLVTALVSAAVLVLIAALADRRGTILFDDAAWALAALVAPTSILWLSVLSSLTGVRVASTGTFRDVDWFPYWLGIPATALAIGVVVWLLRHRSRATWVSTGRWSLTCLTVPALLWVLVGALSPGLGPIDVFHEGEGLVGARLLLDGQVPWRDFLSTHGLLADSLVALPGLALIEDSRWGAASGELIWVTPVYWIFWFAFMAYLLRRNNWLLGLWCALTILGSSLTSTPWISPLFVVTSEVYLRTLLFPLILLAVAWVVRNPVSRRIALLSALVVLQVVLTPETAYLVPGVFITLVVFDLTRSSGALAPRRFRTVLLAVFWSLVACAVLALGLALSGSLGGFVDYFDVFAAGHELTGGLPFKWDGSVFAAAAVGVPLVLLCCTWYGLGRLTGRRSLEVDDFVVMPAFLFALLHYTKFLSRADTEHAVQSAVVVLPVLWYVLARLLDRADGAWHRRARRGSTARVGSMALVGVALLLLVPAHADTVAETSTRYRTLAASEPLDERLGYSSTLISLEEILFVPPDQFAGVTDDVEQVVDALAPGNREVFDFTNSPALFGFALRYQQPTRYYHVSMAIPLEAQRDLIDDLETSRPPVVVGHGNAMGLKAWDGISNMVRHYEVNRYLQTHYRPVVSVDGFLFLLRDDLPFDAATIRELDLNGRAAFGNLDDVPATCDWRAVPERFEPKPAPDAETTGELDLVELEGTLEITGWVADQPQGEAVPEVVALAADGTVLAASAPVDDAPRGSGFRLQVPVEPAEAVVVAARLADGTLLEITGRGVRSSAPETRLADGETVTLGETEGEVESVTVVPIRDGERAYRVLVPGGPRDWSWLTLHGADDLAVGEYTIGTPAGDGDIRLLLTQGGQESTSVMVGACNHWYDYQSPVRVISTPEMASKPRVELAG